ncbi:hypothetical protein ACGF3G_00625 [Streptomyces sp. NPDC048179]|uniref:hypothetical protein n=1 Tax=Streptomyces sp. NPDC048179 TaxID=3365506 RepID=UPI00371BA6F9
MTNTNTTDLADTITWTAGLAARRDESARKDLTDAITAGRHIDSYLLKPVMEAQAKAQLWQQVVRRMEKAGTAKALESVREECTDLLLDLGESQSTCAITNETDRLARDAARTFLKETRRMG